MSSDQPYTPNEAEVRASFVLGETRDGEGAVWDGLIPEARAEFDRFLARVRRDAAYDALVLARAYLSGEDTVEWARNAHGSSMSYPHAIGVIDDLIEDLDDEETP